MQLPPKKVVSSPKIVSQDLKTELSPAPTLVIKSPTLKPKVNIEKIPLYLPTSIAGLEVEKARIEAGLKQSKRLDKEKDKRRNTIKDVAYMIILFIRSLF